MIKTYLNYLYSRHLWSRS